MQNKLLRFLSCWFAALLLVQSAWSYDLERYNGQPISWNPGTVAMQIQLGSAASLSDGSTFNSSVQTALQMWNTQLAAVQFANQIFPVSSPADHNGINEIGFDATVYGTAFDANVLAVTMYYFSTAARADGSYRLTQADIIFNNSYTWDSYRGPLRAPEDIQRVALHELGHVLGLNHPDEASPPQNVTALMNSHVSNLDALAADDIAGAQFLYGVPSVAPTITGQPVDRIVIVLQDAQFSISASGSPSPVFRWQRLPAGSGTWSDLSDGGRYSGTTTSTLTVSSPTGLMTGDQFRCVVTNTFGTATSAGANLTVQGVPIFTIQPTSQAAPVGSSVTFTAATYGYATATYQWQKNGVNISGATGSSFRIDEIALNNAGDYSVVATNPIGSATSNTAKLTVQIPPAFTIQPASQSVPVGISVTLTVVVSGVPTPTYQWRKGGIDINGATNASYAIASAVVGDAGNYSVVVTNAAGSITSDPATLTITPANSPYFTVQSGGRLASLGGTTVFTAVASGIPAPTYQWQKDGIDISGATSGTYYVTNIAADDAGIYTVVATNPLGSITSIGAILTVTNQYTFTMLTGAPLWFNSPRGMAVDAAGNVYITDRSDCTISKITPQGTVTIFAGMAGSSGSIDGTGSAARFNGPSGIAIDRTGTLYVTDQYSHTIRKISPGGVVTTVAGAAGISGSIDGVGAAARFNFPIGIAVDEVGNLYVTDYGNFTVRKIMPDGTVNTLAGKAGQSGTANGTGAAARFAYLWGLAVDGQGNLFVADSSNNTIRKITPAGLVTTFAGTAGVTGTADGKGGAAQFNTPAGVAVDATGTVYVVEYWWGLMRKITPDGTVTTLASFYDPTSLALDSAGNIYVANEGTHLIFWGALTRPVLTSATTAVVTIGQSFSYSTVFGGSLANYTASGLPSGLTIDFSTGRISGTPTVAGTFPIALGAVNGAGPGTATLILTVQPIPIAPSNAIISITVE